MTQQIDNATARALIARQGVPIVLKAGSVNSTQYPYTPGQALTFSVPFKNVGLVTKFVAVFTANVQQGAAETQNATIFGGANAFSQIIVNDFNNLARINTAGWHLNLLATARRANVFGAAYTTDNPNGIGNNCNVAKTPQAVTGAANLYEIFELPLAYQDGDLRGAIFAGTAGATASVQFTLNPNFFVSSTADPVQAVYQSTTAQLGKINSWQLDLYQYTIDQLPRDQNNQYILPTADLSWQYNILNVTNQGMIANADFAVPFANMRQFLSTFAVIDNGGTLNAGSDLNYISLQAANSANLWQLPPVMLQSQFGRNMIGADWPKGVYYLPSRNRPISTINTGNIALNFNLSTVNANAQLLLGYESMILTQQLQAASSLPAN